MQSLPPIFFHIFVNLFMIILHLSLYTLQDWFLNKKNKKNHCSLVVYFCYKGQAVIRHQRLVLYLHRQWPLPLATMNTHMENDSLF